MRATKIRSIETGKKISKSELQTLCEYIFSKAQCMGFLTSTEVLNGSSIKIGIHMGTFRIDTDMLGHNARISRFCDSPKGYKRTNVPTWDQRVEFNNLVNKAFDTYGLKANIISGNYTVRTFDGGGETSWPSGGDRGGYGYDADIETERDARERLDSDRLEAEHKAKTAETRRQKAKEYRAKIKELKAANFLVLKMRRWNAPSEFKIFANLEDFRANKPRWGYSIRDLITSDAKNRQDLERHLKALQVAEMLTK